jgi:hypothetical protein
MSRLVGILTAVSVVVVAMVFAALNAGNLVTINLGFLTLHRAPVALVAFGGLFTGMVVMFATGVHTDLKVRRILRERLAQESKEEQMWIDRNQQDLFDHQPELTEGPGGGEVEEPGPEPPKEASTWRRPDPASEPPEESPRPAPDEPLRTGQTEEISQAGTEPRSVEDEEHPMS